jgi:hypothetical protein
LSSAPTIRHLRGRGAIPAGDTTLSGYQLAATPEGGIGDDRLCKTADRCGALLIQGGSMEGKGRLSGALRHARRNGLGSQIANAFFVTVLVAVVLAGCIPGGRTSGSGDSSTDSTASSARSALPTASASPFGASLPNPARLTGQNCSGTAPTTTARSFAPHYTMRLASGWTDTGDYVHTESLHLELTAPDSYGYAPRESGSLHFQATYKGFLDLRRLPTR